MSKIEINPITGGPASTAAINARFQQIEDVLNTEVLWRDNPPGEPNSMQDPLDMASQPILNLPLATEPTNPVRLDQLEDIISVLIEAVQDDHSIIFNTVAELTLAGAVLSVGTAATTKGCLFVGDGGHGTFISSSTPVGPVNEVSCILAANGLYWNLQPTNGAVNNKQFGDDFVKFGAYLSVVKVKGIIVDGNYSLSEAFSITGDSSIECYPGAVLDFSTCVTTPCITLGAGGFTEVQVPTANVSRGAVSINFGSPPELEEGDFFIIRCLDDFSWQPARSYYRKGEWCRVLSVSGGTVRVESPIVGDYLTSEDISVIRLNLSTVKWSGGKLRGNPAITQVGLLAELCRDSEINIDTSEDFRVSGVSMYTCLDSTVQISATNNTAYASLNYGLVMASCHNVWLINSTINARRHAITLTSGDLTITIPNRDSGAKDSVLIGREFGADMHGSVDNCGFSRCVIAGAQLAGADPYLDDCQVITCVNPEDLNTEGNGVVFRMREMASPSVRVKNCQFILKTAIPGGVGLTFSYPFYFQFGVSGRDFGVIDFSNNTVTAEVNPAAVGAFLELATITTGSEISILIGSNKFHNTANTAPLYFQSSRSPVLLKEFKFSDNSSIGGVFNIDAPVVSVINNKDVSRCPSHGVLISTDQTNAAVIDFAGNTGELNVGAGLAVQGPAAGYSSKQVNFVNNHTFDNDSAATGVLRGGLGAYRIGVVFLNGNSSGNKDTVNQVHAIRVNTADKVYKAASNFEPYVASGGGISLASVTSTITTFL